MKRFLLFLVAFLCLVGAAKAPAKKPVKIAKVAVKTLKNGHYQLTIGGKPFVVRGVCYNPVPIGHSSDYDFWSDPFMPWLADGQLMQKMGVNAVRFYQCGENIEAVKKVIGDLYQKNGIRTIMGHWLGFWNYPAPFYDDENFRAEVKKDVLAMVRALKDEPGVLCWVLGNENNYSFGGKINAWSSDRIDRMGDPRVCLLERGQVYYSFVNELAREIHKIDPNHPVVMGNGELVCLDVASEYAKDIDIIGCIVYRGKTFGNIFASVKKTFDKPLLFVEFGADAYNAFDKKEDEEMQAFFLENQWKEIDRHLANNPEGIGNCLGGAMFEWTDEWWKHNDADPRGWSVHDTESNWSNGSYYMDIKAERNMNMNEEWFGLLRLETEMESGINKRVPRKAYYVIREFWKRSKGAR